jgi:hypothetical protein
MVPEPVSRLDAWKAIADYLGRDVRTAQRWRDERGMPVHRVAGGRGGTVFAGRGELDEWQFQPKCQPADRTPRHRPTATRGLIPSPLWSFPLPLKPGSSIDGAVVGDIRLNGILPIHSQADETDPDIVGLFDIQKAMSRGPAFFRSEVCWLRSGGTLRWKYADDRRQVV